MEGAECVQGEGDNACGGGAGRAAGGGGIAAGAPADHLHPAVQLDLCEGLGVEDSGASARGEDDPPPLSFFTFPIVICQDGLGAGIEKSENIRISINIPIFQSEYSLIGKTTPLRAFVGLVSV